MIFLTLNFNMNVALILSILLVGCYANTGITNTLQTMTHPSPFDNRYIIGNYSDFKSEVMDLQAQYCDVTCDNRFITMTQYSNKRCAPCFCDDPCYYYHDCCPDKILFNPAPSNPSTTKFGCTQVHFTDEDEYNEFTRVIDECPDKFNNSVLLKDCANNNSLHWKYLQPVSDPVTKLSYRNKYCALCNNISRHSSWKTKTECPSSSDYGKANSPTDIYFNVIHNPNCTLSFIPPSEDIGPKPCSLVQEQFYSKCNETGLWRQYDEKVEMACGLYTNVVNGKYKNIFCRLCNEDINWYDLIYEPSDRVDIVKFSLTTLLDLRDDTIVETLTDITRKEDNRGYITCDINEILNPSECKCMNKFCSNGEQLVDGECRSVFLQSNNYGYEICIRVSGTFNTSDIQHAFERFADSVPMWSKIPNIIIYRYFTPLLVSQCNGGLVDIVAEVFTQMLIEDPVNTDEKQNELLRDIYVLEKELSKNGGRLEVNLQNKCIPNGLSSQQMFPADSDCVSQVANYLTMRAVMPQDIAEKLTSIEFVKFNKLLTCIQVHVNSSYVLLSNNRLTLLHNNITLASGEYETRGESFVVCLDDYFYKTSIDNCTSQFNLVQNISKASNETGVNPLGITSVVCTCISLIFLIITFVFYCTVKYMRNIVGVNVMGLIVNLFMAQLVYQFGLVLVDYPELCKAIGILIHYFWLSATFWMNSCTFVLFFKLAFPLKSLCFSAKYILQRCFLYSTFSPALIVMITMVINCVNDGNVGYGNPYMCYINSVVERRFAFALPLGSLILMNIVLFSYTFIKIKVTQMDSSIKRENKVNILACLKLSVITGGAWIFGFIYEATHAIVFAYLFTIMIGTQGMVIFLAFVVNKRVCLSCLEKIRHSSDSHSSGTSNQKNYLVRSTVNSPLPSMSNDRGGSGNEPTPPRVGEETF